MKITLREKMKNRDESGKLRNALDWVAAFILAGTFGFLTPALLRLFKHGPGMKFVLLCEASAIVTILFCHWLVNARSETIPYVRRIPRLIVTAFLFINSYFVVALMIHDQFYGSSLMSEYLQASLFSLLVDFALRSMAALLFAGILHLINSFVLFIVRSIARTDRLP